MTEQEQRDHDVLLLIAEENFAHARDHEHLRAQVTATLVAAAFVLIGLALGKDVARPMMRYAAAFAVLIGLLNVVIVYIHNNRFDMHVHRAQAARNAVSLVNVKTKFKKRLSLSVAWLVVASLPIFAGLGLFCLSGTASAQSPSAAPTPAKVMIVGTFHLDNPGRDVFNVQVDDVLAKQRQSELADIAQSLARFEPTAVMVEWPQAQTDEQYASYRADTLPPSRNEVVQLGFRLAALRKLDRVQGIDVGGEFPFDAVKDYAKSHGMSPRLDAALAGAGGEVQELSKRVREGSIGSVLRYMNTAERQLKNHGFYVDMLRYGDGDTQPGARLAAAWYARNLAICARLLQALPPGGRAVVFYGEGHAYLLRQCVSEAPGVELVEPNAFLPK